MDTHRIVFLPAEIEAIADDGATIMETARLAGVEIDAICGGKGSCGKCRVAILEGIDHRIESKMLHLTPYTESEQIFINEFGLLPQERLACQARILGDVAVVIPEHILSGSFQIRKEAGSREVQIDPAVKKYVIEKHGELSVPQLLERLKDHYGLHDLSLKNLPRSDLADMLNSETEAVTVTVWNSHDVIRAENGINQASYGLALDIGTTTVVGYLCNLNNGEILATEAALNPQIKHGEDIMSRIEFARKNEDGLYQMNQEIITAINQIIHIVAEKNAIASQDISEIVVVGNTVMHHIFLGLDIIQLGTYPFQPSAVTSIDKKAHELGIEILETGNVHALPIEAAFVGADNVGVLIAEQPYNQEDMVLIIDVGTNGELILGNHSRILSASCATGPAFEGGNILFGMRAAPGAIDRVRINRHYEVSYSVIGNTGLSGQELPGQIQARGICGSGIIDAVAEMLTAGIIHRDGSFNKSIECPRLTTDTNGKPVFVIAWSNETAIGQNIVIVQKDIRAIQLAMAAISTGVQLMQKRLGIERPEKVILAGAFGSVIDPERALKLGMFPNCGLENIHAVGNAAGDGARIALLSKGMRIEAQKIAREIEYIELTQEPGFNDLFVSSTHFPDIS